MRALLPWEKQLSGAFDWWARKDPDTGDIIALMEPLAVNGKTEWTGAIRLQPLSWRNWQKAPGCANKEDAFRLTDELLVKSGFKLITEKLAVML